MKLKHGLWALFLTAGFASACRGSKNNNDDIKRENETLAAQNSALQTELAAEKAKSEALAAAPLELQDLEKQISSFKTDTIGREAALEALKAEIEALKTSGNANAEAKITALEEQIKGSETTIAEQKDLVARLEIASSQKAEDLAVLFKSTITPYAGIWLLDPKPELSFSNCQYMIRFDADEGRVYRAAICDEGKIQAEVQNVSGFTANNASGWSGTVGFGMEGKIDRSSCGKQASFLSSGNSYGFDHSIGTATASMQAALFMTSNLGDQAKTFKSGSAIPDLGKNKSCSSIITRSKLASQVGNVLLQQAATVCLLTKDLIGTGCFKAVDQFEPTL